MIFRKKSGFERIKLKGELQLNFLSFIISISFNSFNSFALHWCRFLYSFTSKNCNMITYEIKKLYFRVIWIIFYRTLKCSLFFCSSLFIIWSALFLWASCIKLSSKRNCLHNLSLVQPLFAVRLTILIYFGKSKMLITN